MRGANEIYNAYIDWLHVTPEKARFPKKPDGSYDPKAPVATLPDEVALNALDLVHWLMREDKRFSGLITVYTEVQREFAKGRRCGVCGKNDDPNYDHTREC